MSTLYIVLLLLLLSFAENSTVRRNGSNVAVKRLRRSTKLADIGAAAAMNLLNGASKAVRQGINHNVYVKKGTAMSAYQEFIDAVNRETIIRQRRVFGVSFEGQAGDRIIYYTPFDHLENNKPTIKIYNPKKGSTGDSGKVSDKIIYE